jgi:hypothetical protein
MFDAYLTVEHPRVNVRPVPAPLSRPSTRACMAKFLSIPASAKLGFPASRFWPAGGRTRY